MEDIKMLPGSLDAGCAELLTSSRATRPGRTARLANGMTVLFAAMRHAVWQVRSTDRGTLAELDATDDAVWPSHLADLMRNAIRR